MEPSSPRRSALRLFAAATGFAVACATPAHAAATPDLDAPAPTANPYADRAASATAGAALYERHCALCHGRNAEGSGNVPRLAHSGVQSEADGALFSYITRGKVADGMPAWAALPANDRWQLVTYLKSLHALPAAAPRAAAQAGMPDASAPEPPPPFTDFRHESPGATRRISAADLPPPFATPSAGNGPSIVRRPHNAWPVAPPGFVVNRYARGLDMPRVLRIAPDGDVFVAESGAGRIHVFRGMAHGEPTTSAVFAANLNRPYGIAFYPPGPTPAWVYVGDTDAVLRFPYRSGALKASGPAERLVALPPDGGHWTRDLAFSPDGKTLFVAVGSVSNVDDPDTVPAEYHRADILAVDPDGSHLRVHASGIRNPSGLAIDPQTGALWCTVNERDGLGDNLVPDYITSVRDGGFYGWPWWYIGAHQDPRLFGRHPELAGRVIVPDVLLQPHNASLQLAFYDGAQFPAEYRGDIFAAEHGSWNRSVRAGYEVIRVPRHQTNRSTGEYQDFLTGFVLPNGQVWGRPVGVATAADGSLLVSDDASNSIWRVAYAGATDP